VEGQAVQEPRPGAVGQVPHLGQHITGQAAALEEAVGGWRVDGVGGGSIQGADTGTVERGVGWWGRSEK
jgi:hypothetical protein